MNKVTYYEAELPDETDAATNISGTARVFKCGSEVKINFNVGGIVTKTNTEILLFTLPVDYRPYHGAVIKNYTTQLGTSMTLSINSDGQSGNVIIFKNGKNDWVTGDWLIRQEVSFFVK